MTRINLIPVEELSNQHLLAEHREIKRIPNLISSGKYNLKGIPSEFTLGAGHVKFFYNKIGFLHERYLNLYRECIKRGFNIESYNDNFIYFDNGNETTFYTLYKNYNPTAEAIELSRNRIKEKLEAKPLWYKWTTILTYKF